MSMKKSLAAVIGMASMFSGMSAFATSDIPTISHQRDMQKGTDEKVMPQRERKFTFSSLHDRSHLAGVFKNQRQYRKMVAQNPHLRKSKKHRSKN